jgi:hypothetical protein
LEEAWGIILPVAAALEMHTVPLLTEQEDNGQEVFASQVLYSYRFSLCCRYMRFFLFPKIRRECSTKQNNTQERALQSLFRRADSDGDGQSNGFELGDPCCLWTSGN